MKIFKPSRNNGKGGTQPTNIYDVYTAFDFFTLTVNKSLISVKRQELFRNNIIP